jgi:hypothetical protein
MKLVFAFLLISGISYAVNCSKGNITDSSVPKSNITILQIDFDRQFKNWLNDTLPILTKWKNKNDCSVIRKEVLIDKDSLTLEINIEYQAIFGATNCKSPKVLDIISLLMEYKEPLIKGDKLIFLCNMFYSPSTVEQSRYAYIYEVKNLKVVSIASESQYEYIRGRLSGKRTSVKNSDKTETITQVEFIWHGNKLIKKVVSSQ